MKKRLIISGIVLLILVTAGGIGVRKLLSSAGKIPVSAMPTVKVDRGAIEKVVFAKGLIAEVQKQEVSAEVRAKVTQIAVKVGDRVKTGDLLFAMDSGDSRLAALQEDILYQSKAGDMAKAQAAVSTNVVRTPVAGKVVKLYVRDGDKVNQDSLIAEIADPSIMEVTGAFAPIGIEKAAAGQKIKVFLDNWTYFNGYITKVDKQGRPETGGGVVHDITVSLINPGAVMPGKVNSVVLILPDGTEVCSVGSGQVSDAGLTKVKAGATGTVLKIEFGQGENIRKDAVIARLDLTAGLEALKESKLALQQALLAKEMKARELGKYLIYAGMDGVVTEVNVSQGQNSPSDKPAVAISGAAGLELRAKVEESDIPFIHVGQEATVYTNAFADRGFPGVITEIASEGKSEGGIVVFETKIRLKDAGPLRAGMNGNTDITIERRENVLRLPASAIAIDGSKGMVMVPGQDGPKPKEVKLGLEGDEYIEIREGLKAGDQVLINPQVRSSMGF